MATSWEVTDDIPDQYDPNGGGNPVLGHILRFITGQGNRGSVFVPEDHYNPAAARRLIGAKAQLADEIAELRSQG